MATNLKQKIKKSQQVIKDAYNKWSKDKVYLSFTGGKDSILLLHLVKKTIGEIPSKVMFIEESHFPQVYDFVAKIKKKWNLDLFIAEDKPSLSEYKKLRDELPDLHSKAKKKKNIRRMKELARIMKINAINNAYKKHKWDALLVGIRWDEHKARSEEKYFSPRHNHTRVHPILHFTEHDVWNYIKTHHVPYCSLYDQGYRSLGEKEFTKPVSDPNAPERAGRHKDKEKIMGKLRDLGYF